MATGDDTLTRQHSTLFQRPVSKPAARGPEPAVPPEPESGDTPERIDPLPRPGMAYAAHARHTSRPQMALFLVGKDYLPDGFAYADLRRCRLVAAADAGKGPVLVLKFTDAEVKIEGWGREMFSLCHLIGMHLMPWVWEHPSPGDFKDTEATLIRKITVKDG